MVLPGFGLLREKSASLGSKTLNFSGWASVQGPLPAHDRSADIWKTMLGYIIAAQRQAAGQCASGSGAGTSSALERIEGLLNGFAPLMYSFAAGLFQPSATATLPQDWKRRLHNFYYASNRRNHSREYRCMITRMWHPSGSVDAGHIIPRPKSMEALTWLGIVDVHDERNGILWCRCFEEAYHAFEIALVNDPDSEGLLLRVLSERLLNTQMSTYKGMNGRQAPKLHQDTFGRYDGKPLELQTGNLPFRRAFLAHAAVAVNARTRAGDLRADLQLDQRHWQSRSGRNLRGTTAVVVADRTAIRSRLPQAGWRLLVELKKAVEDDDLFQPMAGLIAANILSAEEQPSMMQLQLTRAYLRMLQIS
ncbi:hypothetical protein WJX84_008767 [Apatococcus fuscideae]|uniref:HNH nuclease domain-containing protein n=1 Tax=Apatococcus fuscideae TaxID=2026836 RepID=A0AAW1T956_9CHLO